MPSKCTEFSIRASRSSRSSIEICASIRGVWVVFWNSTAFSVRFLKRAAISLAPSTRFNHSSFERSPFYFETPPSEWSLARLAISDSIRPGVMLAPR